MKLRQVILLMTILVACETNSYEKTISIVDYRNSKTPTLDVDSHSDKDVEVFRTIFLSNTYSAIIYRIDGGQIKGYQVYFDSKNNYDKVTYKWTTDSTITLKLMDSSGHLTESYSIGGHGGETSLWELD